MKTALLFLLFSIAAFAQNPVQFQPTTTDPTGNACFSTQGALKTPNGNLYTCQNGAMALVGGGGGGSCSVLAGDVTGTCAANTLGKISGTGPVPVTNWLQARNDTDNNATGAGYYFTNLGTSPVLDYKNTTVSPSSLRGSWCFADTVAHYLCITDSTAPIANLTKLPSGGAVGFTSSGDASGTLDTALRRNAAGVVEFDNGTAGSFTIPVLGTAATGDATNSGADTLFVSNVIQTINPAVAVQAATTTVLPTTVTYNNGTAGVGATITAGSNVAFAAIDGYAPSLNDRLLIKNQASALQNGVYTLTTLGNGSTPWVLTRAVDYNTIANINYTGNIPVLNGTTCGGGSTPICEWDLQNQISAVGTSSLTYALGSSTSGTTGNGNVKGTGNLANGDLIIGAGGKTIQDSGVSALSLPAHTFIGNNTGGAANIGRVRPACGDLSDSGTGCTSTAVSVSSDIYANAPSCTTSKYVFFPTDSYYDRIYCDGASTKHYFLRGVEVTPPPAVATFTAIGGGSASDATGGGIYVSNSAASVSIQDWEIALPSTPYKFETAFTYNLSVSGQFGLLWRDHTTGRIVNFFFAAENVAPEQFTAFSKYTNATTFSANYQSTGQVRGIDIAWLKICDDGVNFSVWGRVGNGPWAQFGSNESRTDFLATPDRVGFGIANATSGIVSSFVLLHWKQGTTC